jgi:hypothetical protein
MRWNGVWNELHPGRGIYRGIGDEICDFLHFFFRIFWTPNGQKRLVATASTCGPIRSRHVDQSDRATSLSPHQCLASLSPPSRPPLARAGAPARARARRYRPLSPGASAIALRPPLARARAAAASSRPRCRPHCHQPKDQFGTLKTHMFPSIFSKKKAHADISLEFLLLRVWKPKHSTDFRLGKHLFWSGKTLASRGQAIPRRRQPGLGSISPISPQLPATLGLASPTPFP